MSDALYVVLLLVLVVESAVTGYVAYRKGLKTGLARRITNLERELEYLQFVKKQLDKPPTQQMHTHIWPPEPDIRKMRWLRFKCLVQGCNGFKWEPEA